jgi:hypothetical protein
MSIGHRYVAQIGVLRGVIPLVAMLAMSPASAATYTYDYTGNDFTIVGTPPIPQVEIYTSSDFVSGYVTLSQPIDSAQLTSYSSDVVSFSFSDRVQTLSSALGDYVIHFILCDLRNQPAANQLGGYNYGQFPYGYDLHAFYEPSRRSRRDFW